MSNPQKPQFIWEYATFGAVPRWLSPPDITVIETLCRSHFQVPADYQVNVTFFSEGAFNKLYAIAIPDSDGNLSPPQYIFRATSPVEPFYKTASEVATHSYLRERTSIPVPKIIMHSSSSENELGCEWILMEKIPGTSLFDVWKDLDLETKSKLTKIIANFVHELQSPQPRFTAIGNLYFREDINTRFSGAIRVVPTEDEKYVLGPIATPFMFVGGRKLRVPRDLGPYSDDAEYMTALVASEKEDKKLLLSPDAHLLHDFDADIAEDAKDIVEVLNELQTFSAALFPSRPRDFGLHHHDLSLANILVDPVTYEITGIVDWECVGTRPHWEDRYPVFLVGREITEEIEPLASGDTDECRVEHWEDWEKTQLRPVFDRHFGEDRDEDDGKDEFRKEFRQRLDLLEFSTNHAKNWLTDMIDEMGLCAE